MLITTISIALAISLLAVAYVAWPLLRPSRVAQLPPDDDPLTALIQRKDTILRSIKELEFDYHMGKLSEADFQRFDQRLRQQAIGLIRQIEKVAPDMADLEQQLEEAIAQHRTVLDTAASVATNGTSHRSAAATVGDERVCPECSTPIVHSANFCANCGTSLTTTSVATSLNADG